MPSCLLRRLLLLHLSPSIPSPSAAPTQRNAAQRSVRIASPRSATQRNAALRSDGTLLAQSSSTSAVAKDRLSTPPSRRFFFPTLVWPRPGARPRPLSSISPARYRLASDRLRLCFPFFISRCLTTPLALNTGPLQLLPCGRDILSIRTLPSRPTCFSSTPPLPPLPPRLPPSATESRAQSLLLVARGPPLHHESAFIAAAASLPSPVRKPPSFSSAIR